MGHRSGLIWRGWVVPAIAVLGSLGAVYSIEWTESLYVRGAIGALFGISIGATGLLSNQSEFVFRTIVAIVAGGTLFLGVLLIAVFAPNGTFGTGVVGGFAGLLLGISIFFGGRSKDRCDSRDR